MKIIFIVMLALNTTFSLASQGFDNIPFKEIFDRGYQIKINVTDEPGVVIHPLSTKVDISKKSRPGQYCEITLTKNVKRRLLSMILKKNRVLNLTHVYSNHGRHRFVISGNKYLSQLELTGWNDNDKPTLKLLKEACRLDAKVAEKYWIEVLEI